MTTPTTMPAAFIGHGTPMNALADNRYTRAWRDFGRSVPRPRAILVVSAHWYTNATAVTGMAMPRTIHDFFGFPRELFEVSYPAPGLPELYEEVADAAHPDWVGCDVDSWGIDHGTWSVLLHAFPEADIPVVQLSLNANQSLDEHLELGRKLQPLREQGVLVIGSGNIVHNLGAVDFSRPDHGFDWAHRFDDAAREILTGNDAAAVAALDAHRDFDLAVPTPDHYLPLLYVAGLADGTPMRSMVDGYAAGSLSMAAYTLGADCPTGDGATEDPSGLVAPDAPAEQSNI